MIALLRQISTEIVHILFVWRDRYFGEITIFKIAENNGVILKIEYPIVTICNRLIANVSRPRMQMQFSTGTYSWLRRSQQSRPPEGEMQTARLK